jgi:CRP-like cAMP-binding protein
MMLLSDVMSPWDSSNSHAAAQPPAKVLAIKGPGDSLGVPLIPGSSSNSGGGGSNSSSRLRERRWKVSVRARSDGVKLFRARLDDLARLVEAHPEMESAVKQIVTQQETDMMVAEAMRQLRLYGDCAAHHAHVPDVVMAAS